MELFVYIHPNMQIAKACLENVSLIKFWSISEQHLDLASRLHIQTRLMGNFGLNGAIPWFCSIDGAMCFLCKVDIETVSHFLLDCRNFREHFDSLWANLTIKVTKSDDIDGRQMDIRVYCQTGSAPERAVTLGVSSLPFDAAMVTMLSCYIYRGDSRKNLQAPL